MSFSTAYSTKAVYGKDDLNDGEEVHEVFYKKNAYKTGTGFNGFKFPSFSASVSSSSSSSSSGSGYGYNPSQASSYSGSSGQSVGSGGYSGHNHHSPVQLAPYGSSYGQYTPLPQEKACSTKPKSLLNASTRCTQGTNNCMVQCLDNYQLPNGETKARMICKNGEWVLENLDWTDKLACERKKNIHNFYSG